MTNIVKHYMWKEGETSFTPGGQDIESRFEGLKYSQCDGLLDKGKRKNIHTESYADSDKLRVWQDDVVTREATDITFTFFFTGDNRLAVYNDFCEYISNGKIYYWDNIRKKRPCMVLVEAIKPKDDVYKGSVPYIAGDFKFKNIYGECEDINF